MRVSVVIASTSPARTKRCSDSVRAALGEAALEVLPMASALPTPEAFNEGLGKARGEAVLLCRDEVEFAEGGLSGMLAERLSRFDMVGVAGTARLSSPAWLDAGPPYVYGQWVTPLQEDRVWRVTVLGGAPRVAGGMQALDGMAIALRRASAGRLRFDTGRFPAALWDVDYTFAAHRAGMKLAVCCDMGVVYRPAASMPGTWRQWAGAFVAKHGKAMPRLPERVFRVGHVDCGSLEEALGVMSPPHWARGDE